MPEAASLETKKSPCSIPLSISRPVSFIERAGFLLDPQSSVTKRAVIWTLDNNHSVFNEIQTHMAVWCFFFPKHSPKCLQCMVFTTIDYKAFLTAFLTKKLVEIVFF